MGSDRITLETRVGGLVSHRLAAIELSNLDQAEVSRVVAEEAAGLLPTARMLLWRHRTSIGALVAHLPGDELRSIEISDQDLAKMPAQPVVWSPPFGGLPRQIVEASFGVAMQGELPATLAIPLTAADGPLGFLVVEWEERDQPPPAEALEAFARQAAATLANHEALTRAQRHESQLKTLYETAGELSAKLDLQTVLDAIIERARTLIDTPVAYITLVDESEGEIYMRAATGVSSPAFKAIRLKIGTGLGGAAAASRRALYTSDYLNDSRFTHSAPVDAAVRDEGIRSILGVPMYAYTAFVGIVYVADRALRTFTDADVEILTSLAQHAGMAIDNAALYERATRALAETHRANEIIAHQNAQLRRTEEVQRQLSEVVLAGESLSALVALVARLVDAHVVVLDENRRVVATGGTSQDEFAETLAQGGLSRDMLADSRIAEALRAANSFRVGSVPGGSRSRSASRLVVPVVARGEVLATIWAEISGDDEDERASHQVLLQASRVVALELLKERSVSEVERRLGRELLDELLSEHPPQIPALERRAAELGLDIANHYRIGVVTNTSRSNGGVEPATGQQLAMRLRTEAGALFVGEYGGRLVALFDDRTEGDRRERLARILRAAGEKAVLSRGCAHPGDYRASFLAGDRALALFADEIASPVVDLEDVRVLALLFGGERDVDLQGFVEGTLGALVQAGARHSPDLVRTLEAYLDSGGNAARAAKALHVHVNTLYYRLERLKEVLGDALEDPHRALDLQVALLAWRLLEHPRLGGSFKKRSRTSEISP